MALAQRRAVDWEKAVDSGLWVSWGGAVGTLRCAHWCRSYMCPPICPRRCVRPYQPSTRLQVQQVVADAPEGGKEEAQELAEDELVAPARQPLMPRLHYLHTVFLGGKSR